MILGSGAVLDRAQNDAQYAKHHEHRHIDGTLFTALL